MIDSFVPLILAIVLVILFQIHIFFNAIFGKSNGKPYRFIYVTIAGVAAFLYFALPMPSLVSSMLALLFIYVMAHSYRVALKAKLIYTILYGVLMSIASVIGWNIFSAVDSNDLTLLDPVDEAARLQFTKSFLLSTMIMFAVIQLIRLITRRRSFELDMRFYLLFLFVPIISIFLANVLALHGEKNILYYGSFIGLLLLNVLIIYLFDHIMEKFQLMHEHAQMQRQMDYQDANYEKTVHSFKSIKRIIHDTHQQFLYIEECIRREQFAAALDHIKVTLNKVEDAYRKVNTGNLVLDALVTNALSIAEANGIRMDTKLSLYSHAVGVERYDLCVVLGNMLDNAIEASKKVKVAEDRYVLVEIRSNASMLSIHILNRMEQETDDLRSRKPNPEFHGLGLTNIARICDKYGGNMTIETQGRTFRNMAVLPFSMDNP